MDVSRRRAIVIGAAAIGIPVGAFALFYRPFPSDRTPEGAYMRIARCVSNEDPRGFFAYLETEAQWACFTLKEMRKKARDRIVASYPDPQKKDLSDEYAPFANAPDGSDIFALVYVGKKWARRLKKDLSGAVKVDKDPTGERASIITARGTRYPFRKRDNGIWGLTMFTAELVAEAEKSTRDLAVVEAAAADYDKLKAPR
jgi:hypothetical protein